MESRVLADIQTVQIIYYLLTRDTTHILTHRGNTFIFVYSDDNQMQADKSQMKAFHNIVEMPQRCHLQNQTQGKKLNPFENFYNVLHLQVSSNQN